jgi:hypothetical protein
MSDVRLSELLHFWPKQLEATRVADEHRYMLFGGARGPGKSRWLRGYALRFLLRCAAQRLTGVRVMLGCETFPALRDRQIEKIEREWPAWLGRLNQADYEYTLAPAYGSGAICLRNLDNPLKYQSAEFALIGVDELTKDPESTFNILRGSLRWPGIERPQFVAGTNPNGPGAAWVRAYWIEHRLPPELEPMAGEFAFVPGLPGDNPSLPPEYTAELATLPESLRKAWLEGDWYAGAEGIVYPEFDERNLTDEDVDPTRPIEIAFDDGFIDPRAILVVQRSPTGILVADELYQRRRLAEQSVADLVELCKARGWQLPEIAIGSPEAHELQSRLRLADIPARYEVHKVVDGINNLRRLICDGQGYRALKVNHRCTNLIWEFTEGYRYPEGVKGGTAEKPEDGNDHALDGLRYWGYVRARRG